MSSLDRLIDLAHRTGDRLIVHDPIEGRDTVIMGVDEYEEMINKTNVDCRSYGVRGLTGEQLLDQINRDIAVWRADKAMDEEWENEMVLEDECEDLPPFDPFSEVDYHPADWHTAGAILENKFKDIPWNDDKGEDVDTAAEEENVETIKNIPFKEVGAEEEWTEKNLTDGDEPVFYEEPV